MVTIVAFASFFKLGNAARKGERRGETEKKRKKEGKHAVEPPLSLSSLHLSSRSIDEEREGGGGVRRGRRWEQLRNLSSSTRSALLTTRDCHAVEGKRGEKKKG